MIILILITFLLISIFIYFNFNKIKLFILKYKEELILIFFLIFGLALIILLKDKFLKFFKIFATEKELKNITSNYLLDNENLPKQIVTEKLRLLNLFKKTNNQNILINIPIEMEKLKEFNYLSNEEVEKILIKNNVTEECLNIHNLSFILDQIINNKAILKNLLSEIVEGENYSKQQLNYIIDIAPIDIQNEFALEIQRLNLNQTLIIDKKKSQSSLYNDQLFIDKLVTYQKQQIDFLEKFLTKEEFEKRDELIDLEEEQDQLNFLENIKKKKEKK